MTAAETRLSLLCAYLRAANKSSPCSHVLRPRTVGTLQCVASQRCFLNMFSSHYCRQQRVRHICLVWLTRRAYSGMLGVYSMSAARIFPMLCLRTLLRLQYMHCSLFCLSLCLCIAGISWRSSRGQSAKPLKRLFFSCFF